MRYLVFIIALFAAVQTNAQNNIVYGAGINYTNGAPTFTPPVRTSRVAIDTVTGKWYHFNTPGGWQLIGNTIEQIAGCTAPAYTPGKGDSKVVINNCSPQPELYFYNGSAWVLVGGGSVYAGEGIRIENDTIILDSLYVLRFRTGSNTDGAAGTMSWNTTEETVDLVTDQGTVTGHLMESAYYNTRNTTGTPITIGTVVMANGTTGNTGRILIAPAIADGSVNSEYILGLAAQTIGNNSNGKVQHFGKIRGIQTNGANYGETWVDGDVLYCSAVTPGYLTKVLPNAPNLKVPIAIVIHAHPSNGTLFVRPSHFPDLAQINDVELSSPTNGQVLTYNSTLSRWENATPANQLQTLSTDNTPGNISISSGNTITLNVNDADASATNELQTLSTGTNTLTLSNGGGTVTVDTDPSTDITGSGANGQVSFWTGAQTQSGDNGLFWDNSLKDLGIGTNTPSSTLDVIGNVEFQNPASSFDGGLLGAELLTTGSGANWTGASYSSGYTHTSGLTDNLVSSFTPTINAYYRVSVTVTGVTGGQFLLVGFGGYTGGFIGSNTTFVLGQRATSAAALTITPTSGFTGTVTASISIVSDGSPQFIGNNSSGTLAYEERISATNIFQGVKAGAKNSGGTANIFQGLEAGIDNISGYRNIFQGERAGYSNTNGFQNIFQGFRSGYSNTSGINNIFQGTEAGFANTTGSTNIFQGSFAGNSNTSGANNIFQGGFSGFLNTTGVQNLYEGIEAGRNIVGSNNVLQGYRAGRYINSGADLTTLNNSVFIGFDTRANAIGQSNQIVIGYDARGLGSNTTVLGNSSTTQTWLGGSLTLGTQVTPAARLHVVGSGTSSSTWTAQFHNSAGNNNALMIRDDGNVGIGTSSPATRLNVHGTGAIFQVTNSSSGKVAFRALDDGGIRMGNGSSSPYFFPQTTLGTSSNIDGTNLTFYSYTTSQLAPLGKFFFTGEVSTQTTGDNYCFYVRDRFSPTSGNATSTAFYVRSIIDQTAGGTGITRGLSVESNLINAVQFQSIQWNIPRGTNNWGLYGQGTALNYLQSALAIGTTTPSASAALEISSTTQGVLFPRMTTAQRDLIATPADGLVIYNTTDNKLQVRAAGAWVDLH